jgi:hypothetical protein
MVNIARMISGVGALFPKRCSMYGYSKDETRLVILAARYLTLRASNGIPMSTGMP